MQTPFTSDMCIKCNICTLACPYAAVTPLFPGPKVVGPQEQRFREPGAPSPDHSLDYCSGCGICTLVCPHGVKVMEINTQAKARIVESRGLSFRNWFLSRNERWGRWGTPFAPLTNFGVRSHRLRKVAERIIGVSARGPLPGWAGYTFRGWWKKSQPAILDPNPHRIRCAWSTFTAVRPTPMSHISASWRLPCWNISGCTSKSRRRRAADFRRSPMAILRGRGAMPAKISGRWSDTRGGESRLWAHRQAA